MTVAELITALKGCDPKALIVINNTVVHGIFETVGRVGSGYYDPMFVEHSTKGRVTAVLFTHHTEYSDGVIYNDCTTWSV